MTATSRPEVRAPTEAGHGRPRDPPPPRRNGCSKHQGGLFQDDATLLMLDWSSTGHDRMLPTVARKATARPGQGTATVTHENP
jgi:hypothetical protein